jgi:hypothetical protein
MDGLNGVQQRAARDSRDFGGCDDHQMASGVMRGNYSIFGV